MDCGGNRQGFLLLDWLIPSAHAKAGCTYEGTDGKVHELTPDEHTSCLTIIAGGVRAQVDRTDGRGPLTISEIADALRQLDKSAGLGEHSGSETAAAAGLLKHELSRAAVEKLLGESGLEKYDELTATVGEGLSAFEAQLSKRIEETGRENGYSDQQIADIKYVAGAAVKVATVVVAGKGAAGKNVKEIGNVVDANSIFKQQRVFWSKEPVQFNGNKIYQRNDLIDPNLVDARGRNNIERMQKGLAPIGPDGKSMNLHHTTQTQNGALAEMTQTFHKDNHKIIHVNPSSIPSGIDRIEFDKWRAAYWKIRAKDFM